MKVLIDAHMVGERETGNERYTLNLVRALRALELPAEFVVAAAHPEALLAAVSMGGNWRVERVSTSSWRRLLVDLPRLAARERASLLHVNYTGPILAPCPLVVTVHDVSYLRHPEWFSLRDRLVLRVGVAATLPRARGIITVSLHGRSELCACYGIPEERVLATHLSADPLFRAVTLSEAGRQTLQGLGIRFPYILGVGNLQPRKNLRRLIEAFSRLKSTTGCPHQLVLVGRAKWKESDLYEAIRAFGVELDVLFPGYLSDADLVALYAGADVFVYPSLYEGFGLPVLEAMACGVPVVTSTAASIPEVAGDAALLIDPLDVGALSAAMERVLSDAALSRSLRENGLRRAAQFSWRQTALQTWACYQRVGGDSP